MKPAIARFLESDVYRSLAGGVPAGPALHMPPLSDGLIGMLGLEPGALLVVQGATAGFVRRLWDVLDGVRVSASPAEHEQPNSLLWWPRGDSPGETLAYWRSRLAPHGSVWAVGREEGGSTTASVADLVTIAEAAGWQAGAALPLPGPQTAVRLTAAG
jgi:hypothetical protein